MSKEDYMDLFFQLLKETANNDNVKKWPNLSVTMQNNYPWIYFGKRTIEHEYKECNPPSSFKQLFKKYISYKSTNFKTSSLMKLKKIWEKICNIPMNFWSNFDLKIIKSYLMQDFMQTSLLH